MAHSIAALKAADAFKAQQEAKASKTETKQFPDIKLAFSLDAEKRKGWEQYLKLIVDSGSKVAEMQDNFPDRRTADPKQVCSDAAKALRALGSPLVDDLTSRIITISPPKVDQENVSFYGDSGLNQYVKTDKGAVKVDNTYILTELKNKFGRLDVMFKPHHGAKLKSFIEWAKAANKSDVVNIAGFFLNDVVNQWGGINQAALEDIDNKDGFLHTFLKEMAGMKRKALIVGGNSRIWGVGEDYDWLVSKIIAHSRSYGILTVSGARCWVQLPLIQEQRGGSVVTWHAAAGFQQAKAMSDFLYDLYVAASYYNPPTFEWMLNLSSWCEQRTVDLTLEKSSTPTAWGVNAVPLPQKLLVAKARPATKKEETPVAPISRADLLAQSASDAADAA